MQPTTRQGLPPSHHGRSCCRDSKLTRWLSVWIDGPCPWDWRERRNRCAEFVAGALLPGEVERYCLGPCPTAIWRVRETRGEAPKARPKRERFNLAWTSNPAMALKPATNAISAWTYGDSNQLGKIQRDLDARTSQFALCVPHSDKAVELDDSRIVPPGPPNARTSRSSGSRAFA